MYFRFVSFMLAVLLGMVLLSACQPVTTTPKAQPTHLPTITPGVTPEPTESNQNHIETYIEVASPANMTVGDGFLWVVSAGSIVRIDPQTNQLVGNPIRAGLAFESAIAFSEGALWVTRVGPGDVNAPSDRDEVSRIDPQTNGIVATLKVSRAPMSLAITPGVVWVVNFGQSGDAVIRIDSQTNQMAGDPIQTGSAPLSLAVGEGSLWVANHDADTITRIDLATNQVTANITVGGPHRIAFGEGAVWVANWHDKSVTRIDPQTNQIVGEPIPIGYTAGNIAAGLGSVWVTSDYRGPIDAAPEDVVLVRIDPQTNQAVETIPLGGHPIDVEIVGDAVWVSIQGPNKVLRINP